LGTIKGNKRQGFALNLKILRLHHHMQPDLLSDSKKLIVQRYLGGLVESTHLANVS
jgi:hypothetical protein